MLDKLKTVVAKVFTIIETINEEQLLRKRNVQGYELSGSGIIIHVVEHYSYHTGQIAFFTKELKNKNLDFMQLSI